jgi:hypothetical protein
MSGERPAPPVTLPFVPAIPDIADTEHPILKRAVERLKAVREGLQASHQRHSSHDRTGHQSAYW